MVTEGVTSMSSSQDDSDQTKERQNVKSGWEHLRQHELELVQMLHRKAAEEQEKARRLEAAGNGHAAEAARRQEEQYLKEADDMVVDATDALRRKGDLDKEDEEA